MNTVTLGGLTVGAALLIVQGIRWWTRENHKIGALVPYLLSVAYGMTAIYGIGALLGGIFNVALWEPTASATSPSSTASAAPPTPSPATTRAPSPQAATSSSPC